MRTTLRILAAVLLSGCASTSDSRRLDTSPGVEKPTLLQRLGLGRPLAKKPSEGFIPAEVEPAQLQGVVVPDISTPEVSPPGETQSKARAPGATPEGP